MEQDATPNSKRRIERHCLTIACNGTGGRVGFEINASRAGPLMRVVTQLKGMKRNDPTMRSAFASLWIRSLNKPELHSLIDDVKRNAADATARAIDFVVAESFGMWFNRARAKLCRYFKNHPPPAAARNRLVDAIVERLLEGRFVEQF